MTMDKQELLLIGHGMVGQRFLEALVADEGGRRFNVTVLCGEPRPAYDRVGLSRYFGARDAEAMSLTPPDFMARHGITLKLDTRAARIDRAARTVTTEAGETLSYQRLVLATGSSAFVPPVAGNDRPHCFVYRTLDDLEAILSAASDARVGAVVGGGLLGLEAAKALRDLGLKTHVVEFAPRLMAAQVDEFGGALLREKIEQLGVTVHTGAGTRAIVDGERHRHRMVFGEHHLETDLIVFSAGIRPQDTLARQCGLRIGERGGVVIDEHCLSSDRNIHAIGEVASWNGQVFGLVAPGYRMAECAARDLCGTAGEGFQGADMSTKLKLMGVDVASIGDAHGTTPGSRSAVFLDQSKGLYKKAVVSACGKKLLGAILVGDASDYDTLLQLCLNGIDLPAEPAALVAPAASGVPMPGAGALPASAQICSCNNVSKGALCRAIDEGCLSVAALKNETRAATTCGGCSALVKQVLDSELAKRGVAVNHHLCEHFAYSRQQLYHLVRVEGIRSFEALLARYGKGEGCDSCKPTVASILASCWNDHVLAPELAGLQDTNDYFLANMQRDGSYSVVPRIPGGEITPDKLITLGQVARKYDLYTKITGGQRVDLFGARVDQLPAIWAELVAAGFESGHAYGKSMRTVKSCVGSTWCRYGVQDSVAMAIRLEQRYRGLRSPHKIKLGVSGCTRECAEAQSKDVGVIATDKGWNLYVCGNGGMRPRHAELFASDLDDDTLIRTIDRFLMFYIRTADRLQRTSVWRENLEGGLDYLREVILDNSLGLAAELDTQMAHIVGTYQCEWKATLQDEQKRKRFRHFINDAAQDDQLVYVRERGQRRPAYRHERITLATEE